jgi:hypothetical protein
LNKQDKTLEELLPLISEQDWREEFMRRMNYKTCEVCGSRGNCNLGYTAHELWRRKKGLWIFGVWICKGCDGTGFWQSHGPNENLLRWIYAKIMLKNRPYLKPLLLERVPEARHWIK